MQGRGLTERKQRKIDFIKANESQIREVFTNSLSHTSTEFKKIVELCKAQKVFSPSIVPHRIYVGLFNVATKDIGWRFIKTTIVRGN